MRTIMITGCSSGFGLEIANCFLDRDWNVVATMRDPEKSLFAPSDRLRTVRLDVTDPESIVSAVEAAGEVDVLVNNAGIGWLNALEGTSMDVVRDVFETNVFGSMAMMQAVLPQFRQRQSGVIVNVSSSTTLLPLPLLSVYTASKAAVNALTGSVAIELAEFGIRTHLVLPGASPTTRFGDTARGRIAGEGGFPAPYADYAQTVIQRMMERSPDHLTHPQDVAEAVWRAATDPACPARLPAGADAVALFGEG